MLTLLAHHPALATRVSAPDVSALAFLNRLQAATQADFPDRVAPGLQGADKVRRKALFLEQRRTVH